MTPILAENLGNMRFALFVLENVLSIWFSPILYDVLPCDLLILSLNSCPIPPMLGGVSYPAFCFFVFPFTFPSFNTSPSSLSHHLLKSVCASQTKTLSSHPTLATQPPVPKRHQSTPVQNSVCLFINPNSCPTLMTFSSCGNGIALPSLQTLTVMSYPALASTSRACGDHWSFLTANS